MKQFFFYTLYQPLYNALIFLVWLMPGHNAGLAIILLTILVRLALWPMNNKAFKSQREMKVLQPKIEEIRKKYKKEEQAAKLMGLYKEHKINPYGGCLPMLIQLPIIFVLYRVFMVGLNTSHFNILYRWMPRPSSINTGFLGIDLSQPEKWVLPILTGVLQYIQFKMMQNLSPQPKPKEGQLDMATMMSKQMMYLAPIMSVVIAMRLPAALPLYWSVTTLFAIVQQWWYFRNAPEIKLAESGAGKDEAPIEIGAPKEMPKKKREKKSLLDRLSKPKQSKDVVVTIRRKGE